MKALHSKMTIKYSECRMQSHVCLSGCNFRNVLYFNRADEAQAYTVSSQTSD